MESLIGYNDPVLALIFLRVILFSSKDVLFVLHW